MGTEIIGSFSMEQPAAPAPSTALVLQNAELIALARNAGTEVRDLEAERLHVIRSLANMLAPLLHEAKINRPLEVRIEAWPRNRRYDVQLVGHTPALTLYVGAQGRLVLRNTHYDTEHYWEWNPADRAQDYAVSLLAVLVERTHTIQAELLAAIEFRRNSRGVLDAIAGSL